MALFSADFYHKGLYWLLFTSCVKMPDEEL